MSSAESRSTPNPWSLSSATKTLVDPYESVLSKAPRETDGGRRGPPQVPAAPERTAVNSIDFAPPEERQRGPTISTYRIAANGTRYGATDPVTLNPEDVAASTLHPSASWPPCRCPRHGGRPKTPASVERWATELRPSRGTAPRRSGAGPNIS
ncbi:hypothetical protein [Kitasatospora sp. NPDC091276]|uniref:hypothetical protein n=1 Tax=Kitasatospora sp. NPDC091276 TaxID=3155300 RepID=UPI0034232C81